MPAVLTHPINEDLAKLRERRAYQRYLRPANLARLASSAETEEDRGDLIDSLRQRALSTAEPPPYDPERIHRGTVHLVVGALLVLGGVGMAWYFKDTPVESFVDLAVQLGALALVLVGAFVMLIGNELRRGEHLPRHLDSADVQQAIDLLAATHEDQRASSSAWMNHVAKGLLVFDAAVLLYLVIPLLLPQLTPFPTMIVMAIGALVIGKLAGHAADSVAAALRRGQLLGYHDVLASSEDTGARESARDIRKTFNTAVGGRWPTRPGAWARYRAAFPGLVFLAGISGLLLAMRLVFGESQADLVAIALVGALVAGTVVVAVALKARCECLVPAVARARRIVGRFPTVRQFESEMKADFNQVRAALVDARSVLRGAYRTPRWDATGPVTAFEELDLDDPRQAPTRPEGAP
jgi:hypothetical protein